MRKADAKRYESSIIHDWMVRLVQKLMVAPFDSVLLLLNRDVTGLSYDERDNQLSNVGNDILAIG